MSLGGIIEGLMRVMMFRVTGGWLLFFLFRILVSGSSRSEGICVRLAFLPGYLAIGDGYWSMVFHR